MISWRYHIVSIVAVILAFGLGILAGSSVVNERFIRDLQLNYDEAIRERDAALADVARLERFAVALQPTLRDGRLLGRAAIVVTMEGIDRPAQRVREELSAAGADLLVSLEITRRLAVPEDPEDIATLQEALGTTSTDPLELGTLAARSLAARLAGGPDPTQDDVLGALLAEGFVTADRDLDPADLRSIGGVSQAIVVAAGGTPRADVPPPGAMLVPLVERLVQLDADVAVVGPTDDAYGLVTAVREDAEVPDCATVTIDDVDLTIGGIAFVMGLERLLADANPTVRPGGDYGITGDALVPGGESPSSCRR